MNPIVKGAIISIASALLLGASLALSSASAVSGAKGGQPDKTCSKSGYCQTVQNTGSGGALQAEASSGTSVSGTSTSGYGVYGVSSSNDGLHGVSSTHSGVYGTATGSGNGVSGASAGSGNAVSRKSSGAGYGVYGYASDSSAYGSDGVHGVSANSEGGNGVYGFSSGGQGVSAESNYGVALAAQADGTIGYILTGHNTANDADCIIDYNANLTCTGEINGGSIQLRHTNDQNRPSG
jgi:hypothetical protein